MPYIKKKSYWSMTRQLKSKRVDNQELCIDVRITNALHNCIQRQNA